MQKIIPNIKITKAKISDAQAIRKLEHKVWKEEVVNKYDIPMFVRFGYVFIAKCENNIVGAIVSYKTNKDEVYICDLVVDPKYRNLKIGEKLRIKLFKEVKGMNVVSFLDPKNTPIINLNKKMGAKIVAKIKDVYGLEDTATNESSTRLFVRTKNK